MEELLVYVILLYLEWEADIKKSIIYVKSHIEYENLLIKSGFWEG